MNFICSLFQKKTIRNGIWLYVLQAFNTIIPLISIPYLTRILGSSVYGIFSIALNLVTYFQVLVEYGYGMSATRKVTLMKSDEKSNNNIQYALNQLFTSIVLSRFLLMIIAFLIVFLYCVIMKATFYLMVSIMILMGSLLGYCFQLNWLFLGKQDMKYISIVVVIARTISVALTFVFVHSENDLFVYCVLYAIVPIISNVVALIIANNKYKIRFVQIGINGIIKELKDGFYVFTTQLSAKVFGAIGVTFLGIFATNTEVGVFSAIQKVPTTILLAWSPISQVLYPISSNKFNTSINTGFSFVSRIRKYSIIIFGGLVVIIMLTSYPIVKIVFGDEYSSYSYWIIPLMLWVIVSIINNFSGIQILLASGHDKEYSAAFQIGVMITIITNLVLVYFFKGNGAAISPLISEISLALLLVRKVNKFKRYSM